MKLNQILFILIIFIIFSGCENNSQKFLDDGIKAVKKINLDNELRFINQREY